MFVCEEDPLKHTVKMIAFVSYPNIQNQSEREREESVCVILCRFLEFIVVYVYFMKV